MNFTGERVIPGNSPGDLEAIHRARYALAEREIARLHGLGKDILDAPCGTGYGTAMLGRVGKAYGVDIDPESIAFAKDSFGGPDGSVQFTDCDILSVVGATMCGFAEVYFDAVVCLEGIEHVEESVGLAWIDGFAHIAKPHASLFISTPNPATSRSNAKYHAREYTPTELRDLVETGGQWKVREVYRQSRKADLPILKSDQVGLPYMDDDDMTDFVIFRAERVGT